MNFNVRFMGSQYQEMTVDDIETGTMDKNEAISLAQKMILAACDLLWNADCQEFSDDCTSIINKIDMMHEEGGT